MEVTIRTDAMLSTRSEFVTNDPRRDLETFSRQNDSRYGPLSRHFKTIGSDLTL